MFLELPRETWIGRWVDSRRATAPSSTASRELTRAAGRTAGEPDPAAPGTAAGTLPGG